MMLVSNTQKKLEQLPLMESFYSIQGEGFHQGKAAYFIRLAGCDVGCVWCDVKDSWEAERYPKVSIHKIVDQVSQIHSKIIVITGGEPLIYDLDSLTKELKKKGFKTHLETSGAYKLSGSWDWICFSPKKFKKPQYEFYQIADELKVVIFNHSDFEWAEKFAKEMNNKCKLFLQPEWNKSERMIPEIVKFIKSNPKWGISLQLHKYMNVP